MSKLIEAEQRLSHARLLEILSYNPVTGIFTWKIANSIRRKIGDVAGGNVSRGYIAISVNYERFLAHRLAWFYVHRQWPPQEIDHINGVHSDNRLANIRPTTIAQNRQNKGMSKNNTSGLKGVTHSKNRKRWTAQIGCGGKRIYLGIFDTKELAHAAYAVASGKLHGEFGRID